MIDAPAFSLRSEGVLEILFALTISN